MFIKVLLLSCIAIPCMFMDCISNLLAADMTAKPLLEEDVRFSSTQPVPAAESHESLAAEKAGGSMTLEKALDWALSGNPALGEAFWEVEAAKAEVMQSGRLPNPELELEMEEITAESGSQPFDSATAVLRLIQPFELGGKREHRRQAAVWESDLAVRDYEASRQAILTETAKRFFELLASQQKLAVIRSACKLASNVHKVVTDKVESGKSSPFEEIQSRVALSSAELELNRAEIELETARHALASMWGESLPSFTQAVGSIEDVPKELPSLPCIVGCVPRNAEIAGWESRTELSKVLTEAEKAARIPDLNISAGMEHNEGHNERAFSIGLGFSLPLFDRNAGGVRAADARQAKTLKAKEKAETNIRLAMFEAYQRLISSHNAVFTGKNEILPAAQEAFSAASEGYRLGKLNFLEVLQAQQTLFQTKKELITSQLEYHKAAADIEELTSLSMAQLITLEEEQK